MQIGTTFTDLGKVTKYISYTQLFYSISYLEKYQLDHGTTGNKYLQAEFE